MVAETARSGVQARPRQPGTGRGPEHGRIRCALPRKQSLGTRLRGRLVRVREQGPARPARRQRPGNDSAGRLQAALLRLGLAGSMSAGTAGLAAGSPVRDAAGSLRAWGMRRKRAGELLRHEPLDERERRFDPAVPIPEQADVPAGGRAHPDVATLRAPLRRT